ncbi:MAG: hypothetical protein AB1505_18545 [Candidatus Latescibacterota bacterium]
MPTRVAAVLGVSLLLGGCGYRYYTGPLLPAAEQTHPGAAAQEGAVVSQAGGLKVSLRPMADEELNRQFFDSSQGGVESTNPYTFGDTEFWGNSQRRSRFTVFRLQVHNDGYPKVMVDPARIVLRTTKGREYWSLSFEQLDAYYRAYATGYRGNEYARYQSRRDLLRRTLFSAEEIFSGEEKDGYVVFPLLHADVSAVEARIHDVVLRFDYRNEPVEAADLVYRFTRDIGRIYEDGRVVVTSGG